MKYFALLIGLSVVVYAGWYFISPLFISIEVDDAAPAAVEVESGLMPSGAERLSPEDREAMDEAIATANATPAEPMNESMPTTEPVALNPTVVTGTAGHPAEGTVRVIDTADGQVIRFEDFSTINGPQLHLYLAKDLDATEFIDLGPIRGTNGNINYSVPDDVDLSEYRYVMHWCVPFGVLFNYAELTK